MVWSVFLLSGDRNCADMTVNFNGVLANLVSILLDPVATPANDYLQFYSSLRLTMYVLHSSFES